MWRENSLPQLNASCVNILLVFCVEHCFYMMVRSFFHLPSWLSFQLLSLILQQMYLVWFMSSCLCVSGYVCLYPTTLQSVIGFSCNLGKNIMSLENFPHFYFSAISISISMESFEFLRWKQRWCHFMYDLEIWCRKNSKNVQPMSFLFILSS